ncbi:hypothetical protein N181_31050 [Sinorhizobium fredii USDA 205]|uniref:Formyl transferase n=1 Tax=Rhizobium fredii TaxID=380 RepID=A0A844A7G6_RHIFR|nr:formyltransferase family protein [Sinorhizobium fredii]KSV91472.1 hypothetical protein N181_31050 [Sinorhizobium fredii USDA 205]MQX09104.1 formyl transferase [Sinorhizobium fredii]GLS06826.1 hypothetical protein GCM10007864_04510 [Sinorhizobium fredii]
MKILFLTNNKDVSKPLIDWLQEGDEVLVNGEPLTPDVMAQLSPEIVISYGYRHIIKRDVLSLLDDGFFNLHVSMLPFNRGADPNVWSFLDDTPKGVTIHRIDEGLDTGPIVVQREVYFDEAKETLSATYAKLQAEIQDLFREHWPAIRDGSAPRVKAQGPGSYHQAREFAALRSVLMGPEGWAVPISLFRHRYDKLKNAGGAA